MREAMQESDVLIAANIVTSIRELRRDLRVLNETSTFVHPAVKLACVTAAGDVRFVTVALTGEDWDAVHDRLCAAIEREIALWEGRLAEHGIQAAAQEVA